MFHTPQHKATLGSVSPDKQFTDVGRRESAGTTRYKPATPPSRGKTDLRIQIASPSDSPARLRTTGSGTLLGDTQRSSASELAINVDVVPPTFRQASLESMNSSSGLASPTVPDLLNRRSYSRLSDALSPKSPHSPMSPSSPASPDVLKPQVSQNLGMFSPTNSEFSSQYGAEDSEVRGVLLKSRSRTKMYGRKGEGSTHRSGGGMVLSGSDSDLADLSDPDSEEEERHDSYIQTVKGTLLETCASPDIKHLLMRAYSRTEDRSFSTGSPVTPSKVRMPSPLRLSILASSPIQKSARPTPAPTRFRQPSKIKAENERVVTEEEVLAILRRHTSRRDLYHNPRTDEEIDTLSRGLRRMAAFKDHSDAYFYLLCSVITLRVYEANKPVFFQGDVGFEWFIIFRGSVRVLVYDEEIDEMIEVTREPLTAGMDFGDIALRTTAPRAATIITNERTLLLVVDKEDYSKIGHTLHHQKVDRTVMFLSRFRVFQHWADLPLRSLADVVEFRTFKKGTVVVDQDSPMEFIYFIRKGKVALARRVGITLRSRVDPKKTKVVQKLVYLRGAFGERGAHEWFPYFNGNVRLKTKCAYVALDDVDVGFVSCTSLKKHWDTVTHEKFEEIAIHAATSMPTDESLKELYVAEQADKRWAKFKRAIVDDLRKEAERRAFYIKGTKKGMPPPPPLSLYSGPLARIPPVSNSRDPFAASSATAQILKKEKERFEDIENTRGAKSSRPLPAIASPAPAALIFSAISKMKTDRASGASTAVCYKCNEPGHYAAACPNVAHKKSAVVREAEKWTSYSPVGSPVGTPRLSEGLSRRASSSLH